MVTASGTLDFCGADPVLPGASFKPGDRLQGVLDIAVPITYRFGGRQGDFVSFRSFPHAGGSSGEAFVNFSLYDENRSFLAASIPEAGMHVTDQGTHLTGFPLPQDGIYYLTVCKDTLRPSGNRFTIETRRDQAQPIDDAVTGSLSGPAEVAFFNFSARKGELTDISLTSSTPGFVPYFQVHDPSGMPLIQPQTLRQRIAYNGLFLPVDGVYTISVRILPVLSNTWTGSFILTRRLTPITEVRRAGGGRFSGSLVDPFDVSVFRFNREEFAIHYVNPEASGGPDGLLPFRPRMEILDAEGRMILNEQTNFRLADVALPVPGDYYLRVFVRINDLGSGDHTSGSGSFNGEIGVAVDSDGDGIPDHIAPLPPSQRPTAPGGAMPGPIMPPLVPVPIPVPEGGTRPLPPPEIPGIPPVPGLVPCPEALDIVVGYREGEPGDIFVSGDELYAVAVPCEYKRPGPQPPPNLADAWNHTGDPGHIYFWYADARFVDGRIETHVLEGDVQELGLRFVEKRENRLVYRVEQPPEVACIDLRVICLRQIDDIGGGGLEDGAFPLALAEGASFPETVYEVLQSAMPCHVIAIWPKPSTLQLFSYRPGMVPLPPRSEPFAVGMAGLIVSNGSFYLSQKDYTYPNYGVTLHIARTFRGMLSHPASMMGKGWVFRYDIRLSRTPDHGVEVRNAAGKGRIATYRYDLNLANLPVAVVERNGEPGSPVISRYDAMIDYYRNDAEFAEVLYIRKLKPKNGEETEFLETLEEATGGVTGGTTTTVDTDTIVTVPRDGPGPTVPRDGEGGKAPDDAACEAFYLQRFKDGSRYKYDCFGRIVWMRDQHRNIISFEYGDNRHPYKPTHIRQTDESLVHTLEYEMRGGDWRVRTITAADGEIFRYVYDDDGRLTTVSYPIEPELGKPERATYQYDYQGEQLNKLISARGFTVLENTYANDRLVTQTSGRGTWRFDLGTRTETTAAGARIQYTMDQEGLRIAQRSYLNRLGPEPPDELGLPPPPFTRSWTYNAYSQVLTMTDEIGIVTTMTYETSNHPMTLGPERFDPNPAITFSNNLAVGNLLTRTKRGRSGGVRSWSWRYESQLSRVRFMTNTRGATTEFRYENGTRDGYDGMFRLIVRPLVSAGFHTTSYRRTETFDYTVNGQIRTHDDGAGLMVENRYQGDGQLSASVIDPSGAAITTAYRFDKRGRLTAQVDPEKGEQTFVCDPRGLRLQEADALGHVVRYLYDENGNRVKRIWRKKDDFSGGLVSSRALEDREVEDFYSYDRTDRRTNEIMDRDQLFIDTAFTYGADGRVAEVISPMRGTNRVGYEYNERGLVARVIGGKGSEDETEELHFYDGAGRRVAYYNAMGHLTRWAYDDLGNVRQTFLSNGSIQTYERNENDSITTSTVEGSAGPLLNNARVLLEKKVYHYDEWERNYQIDTWVLDPGGQDTGRRLVVERHFTAANQVETEVIRSQGRVSGGAADRRVTTVFDSARRVCKQMDELGNETHFTYHTGYLVKTRTSIEVNSRDGSKSTEVTTYAYDALGRLISLETGGRIVTYAYDSANNQRLIVSPDGNRVEMRYDGAGRLRYRYERHQSYDIDSYAGTFGDRIVPQDTEVTVHETRYNRNSQVIRTITPNGRVDYEYDALNRMVTATENKGSRDETRVTYRYDVGGRPRLITDTNGTTVSNLYDTLGNLISRRIAPGPGVGGTTAETLHYDGLERPVLLVDHDNATVIVRTYDSLGLTRAERNAYIDNRRLPRLEVLSDYLIVSEYDARGNRTRVRYPGYEVATARDSLGRVNRLSISAGFRPFYQPATFDFSWWGMGMRSDGIHATSGVRYRNRRDYDDRRVVRGFSMASEESLFPWAYSKRHELDSMVRITRAIEFDGRFREFSQPVKRNEDRFEYDNLGQLVRSLRGIEDGRFTRGWSVTAIDDDRTPAANVAISRDPYLTNFDAYKWIVADTLVNPFLPLVSSLLGVEWGNPDYYLRVEERYDKKRNGQLRGKTINFVRINQTRSLTASLLRDDHDFLDEREVTYEYDRNGNLQRIKADVEVRNADGDRVREHRTVKQFTYDYKNRLIEANDFVKIGHFNAPSFQPLGSYRALYSYDMANRLVQITVDNRGVRIPTSHSRVLRWDAEQLVQEQEKVADDLPLRTTHRYVWGPAHTQLLTFDRRTRAEARQGADYHRYYPVTGPDGRAALLLDSQGSVVEVYGEDDKGNRKIFSRAQLSRGRIEERIRFEFDDGKLAQPHIFDVSPVGYRVGAANNLLDEIAGLIYMYNRWYSPELGRFIGRDPSAMFGGAAYAYGGNNPVGTVDRNGAEPVSILIAAGIGATISGVISWAQQPYGDTDWGQVGKDALIGGVTAAVSAGAVSAAAVVFEGTAATVSTFLTETAVDTAFDVALTGEDALKSLVLNALLGGLGEGVGKAAAAARKRLNVSAFGGNNSPRIPASWPVIFDNVERYRGRFRGLLSQLDNFVAEFDINRLRQIAAATNADDFPFQLKGDIGEGLGFSAIENLLGGRIAHLDFQVRTGRIYNDDFSERFLDYYIALRRGQQGEVLSHFNVEIKNWDPASWDDRILASHTDFNAATRRQMTRDRNFLQSGGAPLIPVWFVLQGFGNLPARTIMETRYNLRVVDFSSGNWFREFADAFGLPPHSFWPD